MRKKSDFAITLETSDENKYSKVFEFVRSIAKSAAIGPRSKLDLLYYLDDEKTEMVNFPNLKKFPKTIEADIADSRVLNYIIGILYSEKGNRCSWYEVYEKMLS